MSCSEPRLGVRDSGRSQTVLRVWALSWAVLPLACVGEQGEKPTKEQQEALAETICEKRAECCSELYAQTNMDTCLATQGAVVGAYFNRIEAAVDRGGAAYAAGKFEECASALSSATCTAWIGLESGDWPEACRELVRGSLGIGSVCEDHFDCSSGWCDEQGVSGAMETCRSRGEAGDRCGAAEEGCNEGLHCKRTADSDSVCATSAPPGGTCSQGSDCDSNACLDGVCITQCMVSWVAWPN